MVNLPVFGSTLPLYFLSFSSARSTAVTAVTPLGSTMVPVIVPLSAAMAEEARSSAERKPEARAREPFVLMCPLLSALVGRQVVLVDVQHQRRQGRRVRLVVRRGVSGFRRPARHVPAAVVRAALPEVLLAEKHLADRAVPLVPLLAAVLVERL